MLPAAAAPPRPPPPGASSVTNLTPLDGILSKYTNVMKGWQNRYFMLNPQQGVLEYHVSKSEAFAPSHRPRGFLHLAGAVISPSTDDKYTFSVNAANSEVYKLRANDTKERQLWVSHLCQVADHFTQQIARDHPPISGGQSMRKPRSISSSMTNIGHKIKDAADQVQQKTAHTIAKNRRPAAHATTSYNTESGDIRLDSKPPVSSRPRTSSRSSVNKSYGTPQLGAKRSHKSDCKELRDVREALVSADNYHAGLMNMLENLPHVFSVESANEDEKSDGILSALDEDVLLLKSTSSSTLKCLNECYTILQQYQHKQFAALPPGVQISWVEPRDNHSLSSGHNMSGDARGSLSNQSVDSVEEQPAQIKEVILNVSYVEPTINPADEVCDLNEFDEEDLGTVEKHKSVIMHLLSQLKLGMDLTRVTLPTFILEKRSLLEMYSDFLGHPELFISIPGGSNPRDRMIRVVKYYLTSFHCGRRGQLAKKPYNPIIGETFQCSYYVPRSFDLNESFDLSRTTQVQSSSTSSPDGSTHYRIRYASEQVSHHPPVSAFYAECPEREICMNTHIWTKSKFMNMSIGVVNIGEGVITLTGHKERYVATFPSAFARSILTTPWMELGGRCTITCDQTNLAANVTFHPKPMYGGQPHRITAEVKDMGSGSVFCRAEGEWNGNITFTSTTADGNQKTEVIETPTYKSYNKYVRPLNLQEPMESRNLWKGITAALIDNDITTATDRKTALEDWQRKREKRRLDSDQPVKSALFHKNGDAYVYKNSIVAM
ncbi:oxysterol-binding protein-related protein 11-like isoform X1 [Styela clava]